MVKRFLQTFSLFTLLFMGYGLTLVPLLLIRPHVQSRPFMGAMAVWLMLFVLSLPFLLRIIIKKVWFFAGKGEPIIFDLLQSMLLGINDFQTPVIVRKKRGRLIIGWRCDDPQWCERMALESIKKTYELKLNFDHSTRTVTMQDRVRNVDFALCPIKVTTGFFSFPGFYCRIHTCSEWGLKNFEHTAADQYFFKPQEIKSPVFNTIINNGWNIRFTLF